MNRRPGGRYFKYRPPPRVLLAVGSEMCGQDRLGIAATSKGAQPVVVPGRQVAGAASCAMAEGPGDDRLENCCLAVAFAEN